MQQDKTLGKTKKDGSMGSFRRGQLRFIWGWIIIPIISWLVFFLYVNMSSFIQAFQDRVTGEWTFQNFVNFWRSLSGENFSGGGRIDIALGNTMKFFFLGLVVNSPIQLFVAYFLFKKILGYKFYRFVFYFPVIISNVAMTGVFKEFIETAGPLGQICESLGIALPAGGLLNSSETVVGTVMVYSVWDSIGLHMLLYCGAMARIPLEVLESGRLDGVGGWRELINLILPLIWPTMSTLLMLQITGILGASGQILLLVGENDAFTLRAQTLSHWIFSQVYKGGNHMQGQYSLVSATGLSLTLVMLPFVMFVRWLFLEKIPTVEY